MNTTNTNNNNADKYILDIKHDTFEFKKLVDGFYNITIKSKVRLYFKSLPYKFGLVVSYDDDYNIATTSYYIVDKNYSHNDDRLDENEIKEIFSSDNIIEMQNYLLDRIDSSIDSELKIFNTEFSKTNKPEIFKLEIASQINLLIDSKYRLIQQYSRNIEDEYIDLKYENSNHTDSYELIERIENKKLKLLNEIKELLSKIEPKQNNFKISSK